ncbi:rhomboid family intramembrane serine protease [Clostridium manihotivorum]|uniref:Rhomboid family intramembrane serine protease n=1 Tax=Clostridium manihotivorum TaxID=2320868 RepID=A0A410DYM7_9CLOT|nr:rhomboid family intramembrane serine protease [Clostridium manihotivorum]QAA34174.1 rhomboid family intramembrane serine protease [Clostridium manihotivorum]
MKIDENSVLQYLVQKQGFFIEEYDCVPMNTKRWIAIRDIDNGVYAVIVSEESYEEVSAEYAGYYLRQRGEAFTLINVVITEGNYNNNEERFYSRVIYDKNNNQVLRFERNGEFVVNCIKEMNGGTQNKFNFSGKSKITFVLIAINIVMFIITALASGDFFDINGYVLVYFGAKQNDLIQAGQYYRLVTAMFLHGGLMHIAFNMYALYGLGNMIEMIYGKWRYLVIYFVAGILSTLTSYIFSYGVSVGASGAIFGLLGAAVVFGLTEKDKIGKGFLREMVTVIGLNVLIGISTPNIDNFGHFGGLLGGIIISFLIYDRRRLKQA